MFNPGQLGSYFKAQWAAAPGRLITLGALGVVLVTVVGLQVFGGPASAGAAGTSGGAAPLPVLITPSAALGTGPAAVEVRPPLPPLPAEPVRDLFALLSAVQASGPVPGLEFAPAAPEEKAPALSDDKTIEPIDLRLQATYESTGNPPFLLAVIGGRVVRVGDHAGEWEVESIRPREVTIRSSDRSIVLKMP